MVHHDLLATCWTTAGDAVPLPGRDVSPVPLRSRIEEAGRAGFTGFGLLHTDLEVFLRTSDLSTLHKLFADSGLNTVELEFLTDWWKDGAERDKSDRDLKYLLDAAEALSPHHVKIAPDINNEPYELDHWAEQFHRVCASFASVGTTVALEFMPFANISSIHRGVELVQAAGHPSGGLMVDLWHVYRSGATFEELAKVPPNLIKGVEMDDGDAVQIGDGYSDTVHRRLLCGQGVFRVPEFINVMLDLGWVGPWGVEILSETYRAQPLEKAVPAAFDTAIAQFSAAETLRASRSQG